jgi:hypothetical protein
MDIRNPGGTPGGMRPFVLGLIMTVVGGYLLLQQVSVHGGYWYFGWLGGYGTSFGMTLLPLLFGIGLLFYDGRSLPGRLLTVGGALVILAGIIANLQIHFRTSSLFDLLVMLVLLIGGLGLIVRAVLPVERSDPEPEAKPR